MCALVHPQDSILRSEISYAVWVEVRLAMLVIRILTWISYLSPDWLSDFRVIVALSELNFEVWKSMKGRPFPHRVDAKIQEMKAFSTGPPV